MKVDRAEFEKAVESGRSKAERIQIIGALLGAALGSPVVVVGGSAIEVHTSGRTSSSDIDFVTPDSSPRSRSVAIVKSWGFVPNGRVWRRPDWNVDLDLLGQDLKGSRAHLVRVETAYGPIYLLGYEDLIAKRLAELKHGHVHDPEWRRDLLKQVRLLLSEHGEPRIRFCSVESCRGAA
jgi:hypothetical protein